MPLIGSSCTQLSHVCSVTHPLQFPPNFSHTILQAQTPCEGGYREGGDLDRGFFLKLQVLTYMPHNLSFMSFLSSVLGPTSLPDTAVISSSTGDIKVPFGTELIGRLCRFYEKSFNCRQTSAFIQSALLA